MCDRLKRLTSGLLSLNFLNRLGSSFDPVLQSTAPMPSDAAPPEDLATLLKRPEGQVVDVIALVVNVSEAVQKTTSFGIRDLVDVTIMDDSGTHGAASCQFPAWFPKTLTSAPSAQLRSLKEAAANHTPMAFFNLVVQKEEATTGAPEHGAWGMEHRALSMEHRARSTEHRSWEHGAWSTEHRARTTAHGA